MEIPPMAGRLGRRIAAWALALWHLPDMRAEIERMKRAGGDPLRCTACGAKLTVTAIRDLRAGFNDEVFGEELDLRCDTAGCVFTPRKREIRFREE